MLPLLFLSFFFSLSPSLPPSLPPFLSPQCHPTQVSTVTTVLICSSNKPCIWSTKSYPRHPIQPASTAHLCPSTTCLLTILPLPTRLSRCWLPLSSPALNQPRYGNFLFFLSLPLPQVFFFWFFSFITAWNWRFDTTTQAFKVISSFFFLFELFPNTILVVLVISHVTLTHS